MLLSTAIVTILFSFCCLRSQYYQDPYTISNSDKAHNSSVTKTPYDTLLFFLHSFPCYCALLNLMHTNWYLSYLLIRYWNSQTSPSPRNLVRLCWIPLYGCFLYVLVKTTLLRIIYYIPPNHNHRSTAISCLVSSSIPYIFPLKISN